LESGDYSPDVLSVTDPKVGAAPVAAAANVSDGAAVKEVKGVAEVKIEARPVTQDGPGVGSSMELFEKMSGQSSDAPLCMTCGVKMRMAGSCFVCEGCGNTSGCS
jgi:ribonucleoside-diphosphate reductase alpha chain